MNATEQIDQIQYYELVKSGQIPLPDKNKSDLEAFPVNELYKRLFGYVKPYLPRAIIATIITVPIGALDAAITYSLKPFIDGMNHSGAPTHGHPLVAVSWIPFCIIGFTLIQGLLNYYSVYLNGWLGNKMMIDIQKDLFAKLQVLDLRFFDSRPTGWIIQRFFRDPEALQTNILDNTRTMLTRFFSSIFLMGALILISWKLSIIAAIMLGITLIPAAKIRSLIQRIAEDTVSASSALISFYTDTVGGSRVVFGYNMEKQRTKQFAELQQMVFHKKMKRIQVQGWLTPSMYTVAALGIALVIYLSQTEMFRHELTPGAFVSFLATMLLLYNPIKSLGPAMINTHMSLLAARRIFILLDKKLIILSSPNAKKIKTIEKGVRFENVSFFYNYQQMENWVLKDINLTFKKGEMVALVGPSGGGKTTLVNLIPRFYEVVQGRIFVDDVDIRDITLESLRSNITVVFQENFFFNGTLYDNLIMSKPSATEAEILEVLERAYLADFVATLKNGIHTPIGERGVLLSGGQRQRLAIARALLKDAPVVILDEATSALDNYSEMMVHKAMEALTENRTVIIIAHRLSTIRNADRIVVINNGQVLEQGTHQELMDDSEMYGMLYRMQFEGKSIPNPESLLPEGNTQEIAHML